MNRVGFVLLFLLQACGGLIEDFSVGTSPVSYGGSTTLTARFKRGTGEIDNGIGAVTSGVPVSTHPLRASTTFTLTVTEGQNRDTATVSVDVTPPQPPPKGCVMAKLTGGPLELSLLVMIFALLQGREVQKRRRARIVRGGAS
jgi:hypothetical protein